MEGDRAQHHQQAFDSLNSAQGSTFPDRPELDNTNVWNVSANGRSNSGDGSAYNNAPPSSRYRASQHPHRSTQFIKGALNSPRLEPPPTPCLPQWVTSAREPDMESQTDTVVDGSGEGGMKRFSKRLSNRFSKMIIGRLTFWQRLRGDGKRYIGWGESFKNMATFTWLNFFLIFVPISWGVEHSHVSRTIKFTFSFLAIMPLSKILDYGSEQLAMYCGKTIGDLIIITLNNTVETVLAIALLEKCELDLLQSSAAGVVLLRLLLVPGTSFALGGASVLSQELHPHVSQLNNTLLILGVLTFTLPTAFFSSLDRVLPEATKRTEAAVTETVRNQVLSISRAIAILLVVTYICSRIYLHNPPGQIDALTEHPNAPDAFKDEIAKIEGEEPVVNPWVCIIALAITVALLAVTAEHLVTNIRGVEERFSITHEWFGLILLPFVSYSADGILSTVYFIHSFFRRNSANKSRVSPTLAQGLSIDLAIQFLTFWLPFIVIVGWWINKPMSLLINLFEVTVLVGSCFLVTFVTVDAKTNWVEGLMMVIFYIMIVVAAWFYPGQADIRVLHSCLDVQDALLLEHQTFAAIRNARNHTQALPIPQKVNDTQKYPTAEAVDLLNERLQQILELHHVLPNTETRQVGSAVYD